MTFHIGRRGILVSILFATVTRLSGDGGCAPFTTSIRGEIIDYVRKLATASDSARVSLVRSTLDEETCYRKLEFDVAPSSNLVLFLSPDQRFLAPEILDSRVDPMQAQADETRRTDAEINSYLASHKRPIWGTEDAPVTIAVFSDFQCPYCRRAMELLMKQVAPKAQERVRVAYFHFPLPSHPWARPAADAASCVSDAHAFWSLEEFFFAHQPELNAKNVRAKVAGQLASGSPRLFKAGDKTGRVCV